MTGNMKTIITEMAHQFDLIGGHSTLGIGAVVIARCRFVRPSIASQIGRDHPKSRRDEPGGDRVPACGGLGIAMQQQDRRPHATDPCLDRNPIGESDQFGPEALKHSLSPRYLRELSIISALLSQRSRSTNLKIVVCANSIEQAMVLSSKLQKSRNSPKPTSRTDYEYQGRDAFLPPA